MTAVWLLILEGRQFGVDVKVYADEGRAVATGRAAMQAELDRWNGRVAEQGKPEWERKGPDQLKIQPGADEPYFACTEDGLSVTVRKAEVQ